MSIIRKIFNEHIEYRQQILKLSKNTLVKKYSGSFLGWFWALVRPAMTIFVFWFAFDIGLRHRADVEGYSFFLWLIAGYIPWHYMGAMLSEGATCIRANSALVTKMRFPASVVPTFISLSNLFLHVVLMAIVVIIYAFAGHMPDLYYLNIPFYMLLMFLWFTVWGLFAGMMGAISKDFVNLINALKQAIFWMSGIIYNVQSIDIPWVRSILSYNPVTIVATGYRHGLVDKVWFFDDLYMIKCYVFLLIGVCLAAYWAYRRLYKEIPDVLG